jgi:hypothetical protein
VDYDVTYIIINGDKKLLDAVTTIYPEDDYS